MTSMPEFDAAEISRHGSGSNPSLYGGRTVRRPFIRSSSDSEDVIFARRISMAKASSKLTKKICERNTQIHNLD